MAVRLRRSLTLAVMALATVVPSSHATYIKWFDSGFYPGGVAYSSTWPQCNHCWSGYAINARITHPVDGVNYAIGGYNEILYGGWLWWSSTASPFTQNVGTAGGYTDDVGCKRATAQYNGGTGYRYAQCYVET